MKTIASLLLSTALLLSVGMQTAGAGSLAKYEFCLYDIEVCLAASQ